MTNQQPYVAPEMSLDNNFFAESESFPQRNRVVTVTVFAVMMVMLAPIACLVPAASSQQASVSSPIVLRIDNVVTANGLFGGVHL